MKKRIACSILTVVIILSLGACAGGSTPAADGNAPAANGNQPASKSDQSAGGDTLEVWVRDTYYNEVVDAATDFADQSGIQINVTQPSDMSDDLALALSSGNTPDVVSMDCVLVPYYASIGALQDVTPEFNALEFKDTFSGGLIDLAQYDGKQFAVPFGPDLSVMLYNKDLFASVGLDPEKPPQTWDELIEYAQKCTSDDVYGYVFCAADSGGMMFTFGPYIWSNGGDFTNEDGTQSALDTPQANGALQLIVDMVYKYKVTPESISSYKWADCMDAFKAGKAAMVVFGSSSVGDIVNNKYDFNTGCALIPSADGKNFASFSGGDSIAIISNTTKKEQAWQFIEYCLSEDFQVNKLAANSKIPARTDLYDNPIYAGHDEYKVLQDALKVGRAPYSLKYNEMYTPWLDAIQFALNQEKTVDQALKDAKTEIDSILAE